MALEHSLASVVDLLARKRQEHPQSTAVSGSYGTLTFSDLGAHADALGSVVQGIIDSPGTPIGYLGNRTVNFPASVLGILSSGAAYVPLDPTWPPARIADVAREAGVAGVLAERILTDLAAETGLGPVVAVDDVVVDAAIGTAPLRQEILKQQLAYVMFTSGSTGRPKGVGLSHESLLNNCIGIAGRLGLESGDRVLQFAPLGVDISLEEMFSAWAVGGSVVLMDPELAGTFDRFGKFLEDTGVSILDIPTPFWLAWVEALEANDAPAPSDNVRIVAVGSEEVPTQDIQRWLRYVTKHSKFSNMYGATETAATPLIYGPVTAAEPVSARSIGRPIPGVHAYVLDEKLRLTDTGDAGELYIGGKSVAQGYLGQPALTAERFLPDPFSLKPGARMYATGDSVAKLSDGSFRFMGRLDTRLKVQGFTVEPSEVEAVIKATPRVLEARVWSEGKVGGEDQIVAEIVPMRSPAADSRTGQWRDLYDRLYRENLDKYPPELNAAGWVSSIDGQPIPVEEMERWRDSTVARIRSLRPNRVYEVGCGTGMLLHAVAPYVDEYAASDFSPVVIDYLNEQLIGQPYVANVRLHLREADDLDGMPNGRFDTAILNSIVQHLPDLAGLDALLHRLAARLAPNAKIFIGDVRNYDLLSAHHGLIQSVKAPGVPSAKLRERIMGAISRETELLISPTYFRGLRELSGRSVVPKLSVKRGRDANEMTLFRYDVVLLLDEDDPGELSDETIEDDWRHGEWTQRRLGKHCRKKNGPLVLRNIADTRLASAMEILTQAGMSVEGIAGTDYSTTDAYPDPEDLWSLPNQHGYKAQVTPAVHLSGHVDLAIYAPHQEAAATRLLHSGDELTSANFVSNVPYRTEDSSEGSLDEAVREELCRRLPVYMHPRKLRISTFEDEQVGVKSGFDTEDQNVSFENLGRAERDVVTLWQELLGKQQIGPTDSFLDLGGNSLLAIRMLTRLHSRLEVNVSLNEFFEAPTVSALAAIIETSQGEAGRDSTSSTPLPAEIPRVQGEEAQCWFGQERLWFLHRLASEATAYNAPFAYQVKGEISVPALRQALRQVMSRHEPLRTAVVLEQDGLVQRVVDVAVDLREVHVDADPAEEESAVQDWLSEFASEQFSLETGRVLRVAVLHLGGDRHILCVVVHHIAFDEWSIDIFFSELGKAYQAALNGSDAVLPPLPVRYRDFAAWQRSNAFQQAMEPHRRFWKRYLSDLPQLLDLPTDRPRLPVQTFEGDTQLFSIPKAHAEQLRALAQREGVTLFHTLMTLFVVFLAKHTGRWDVVVGVPVANRSHEALERLIGFFVNTLPLRADLSDNPRLAQALRRVSDNALQVYAAGTVPFEQIVELAGHERDLGHNPVFQTMFLMETIHGAIPHLGPAQVGHYSLPASSSTMDLTMSISDTSDGVLEGTLWYSRALFDARTVNRMSRRFLTLIEHALADPEIGVKDLNLLPDQERALVLAEWNDTDVPGDLTLVHRQVREAAIRNPSAIAIVDGERSITYAELQNSVDRTAQKLLAVPNQPAYVAVMMKSSAEFVVAMLAVMNAGSAFVPLDPEWPADRLEQVLNDLGSTAILSSTEDQPDRVPICDEHVLFVDIAPDPIEVSHTIFPDVSLEAPIYAIYTSGSTGNPKGAIVNHRGVANRLVWMTRRFGEEAACVVLQTTPPVYDSCVWEYLWPLTVGGQTVIASGQLGVDLDQLTEIIERYCVRTIDLVPSLVRELLDQVQSDETRRDQLSSLRVVIVGGEALGRETADQFDLWDLSAKLYNLYGPTEAAIGSIFHEVTSGQRGRVPIGTPIDNTGAVILDERLRPVPVGVVGELYLAGHCLGLGYLNDRQTTRRRFLDNPFRDVPGSRLYRTGDLACFRESGEIELHGRLDNQLNIRGVRVEPSEVEAALQSHPDVREVVVSSVRLRPGEPPDSKQDPKEALLAQIGRLTRMVDPEDVETLRSWVCGLTTVELEAIRTGVPAYSSRRES